MAVYNVRLFIGTLPSGPSVCRSKRGRQCHVGPDLSDGWHLVEATRHSDHLTLKVDGQEVARSRQFPSAEYNLDSTAPLEIGFGGAKLLLMVAWLS